MFYCEVARVNGLKYEDKSVDYADALSPDVPSSITLHYSYWNIEKPLTALIYICYQTVTDKQALHFAAH